MSLLLLFTPGKPLVDINITAAASVSRYATTAPSRRTAAAASASRPVTASTSSRTASTATRWTVSPPTT